MRHSFKPLQLFWVLFNHCPATIPANFSLMKIKPTPKKFQGDFEKHRAPGRV